VSTDKRLLMVGAGSMGSGYLDAAARRGLRVALVERDRWTDIYRDRVAALFPCAASTDEHWTAAAVSAARRWHPDLVVGFAEPHVLAAAWVQDSHRLPGPGLRAAVATRNKALQRTLGAVAEVPQPEFAMAYSAQDASTFADGRYPVVVKPLRSSGSRGVVSVADDRELAAVLDGYSGDEPVLIERQVDGPEFSCELLVHDGEIRFENYTRKTTSGPPEFVEVAHLLPVELPAQARAAAGQVVRRTLSALDVRTSLVHLEFRLAGGQPYVLETAVRTPGDRIMDLLGLAYGTDMYGAVLDTYLGRVRAGIGDRPGHVTAIKYFQPDPGEVVEITGAAEAAAIPGVHRLELPYRPGTVVTAARSSGQRGGFVIVRADSEQAVTSLLAEVDATVRICTK
jgi:biotin carboxylase